AGSKSARLAQARAGVSNAAASLDGLKIFRQVSGCHQNRKISKEMGDKIMNLKLWFKGLGVFVLSSFITALATMTLDPGSFNFSRAGLVKVGLAALVIGIKAVLLYLKQSPLPGTQQTGITDWTKITGVLALCAIVPAVLTGCVSSWDRSTYASLAAS